MSGSRLSSCYLLRIFCHKITRAKSLGIILICLQWLMAPAWAVKIEVIGERGLDGLIPSYLINRSGFEIPESKLLKINGYEFGAGQEIFPMLPIYKSFTKGKSFLGIKVPYKYLYKDNECVRNTSRRTRTTIVTRGLGNNPFGMYPPQVVAAMEQIGKIKLPEGRTLNAHVYDCEVYGIDSHYQVQYYNSESFLSIGPSSFINQGPTVVLGKETNWFGLGINFFGPSTVFLGGQKGINFASAFNSIFDGIDVMMNMESAENLMMTGLSLAPFVMGSLAMNARQEKSQTANGGIYTAMRGMPADSNSGYTLPAYTAPKLAVAVPREAFTSEMQNRFEELRRKLKREVKWKEDLADYTKNEVITIDPESNVLIQQICDYLASVYSVPSEIAPRCRIAASWEPNAYAYPGGDIFFTAGLIGIMSDLDSLMLVAGHEIGHTLGRHTTRTLPMKTTTMYAAVGLGIASQIALTSASLSGGMGYLGDVNLLNWFWQANVSAMGGGLALGYAFQGLFFAPVAAIMARSREMEWEADRFGHQAALFAGAHNDKIAEGWNEFKTFIGNMVSEKPSLYKRILSSHPDSGKRLAGINERYGKDFASRSQLIGPQNRLPDEFYRRYSAVHTKFQPGVRSWGEKTKARLEGARKNSSESLAAEHSLQTLMSPAGSCIKSALGADL